MRRAANIDANQVEIVRRLRQCGVTVQCLHALGQGSPDLLAGWRGQNFLFEIKDGSKAPSRRQLTSCETTWHGKWAGQVAIVNSFEEAMDVILSIAIKEKGRHVHRAGSPERIQPSTNSMPVSSNLRK
jgi:hypothetical protein